MPREPWYESDNPSRVARGAGWRTAVWIVVGVVFFGLLGIGIWAFKVATSDVKGRGDATVKVNSADNRLFAQGNFHDLYNEVKATDKKLDQAAADKAAHPNPADQLKNSLERKNLRDRLLRTNKPDAIGYVYLMSFGKIIGYYTVKGKVSSTQSQMTTDNLVQTNCHSSNGCNESVVNAPGDDGSYGQNEPGIFFFTTNGAMVTTDLDYIWADAPLPIDVPRLDAK